MNNYREEAGKVLPLDPSRGPASAALESLLTSENSGRRNSDDCAHRRRPMIDFTRMKRHHSQIGSFDMSSIEEASKKVESSIAFPTIEWPVYDGDDETDSEDIPLPQFKRPRLGLIRSAPSFNLVALGSSERLQSDDELC